MSDFVFGGFCYLPWEQIAPHLDEGLNQLSASDRDAIVLRFFKQQDFRVIGAALGVSEDAAQKRVSRALEKLRGVLTKRGATLTATALASALTAEAVVAAPAGLAMVAENQRLSNLLARAGSAPSLTPEQRGELLRLRGEATRLRADVQANAKAASPMVEMLKSPEGKEMMKANMRAMGQSVARSYAKLFADLHLTPEQTAAMKDLIINKTMASADMVTAAMSGQTDPAQIQAQGIQVKADQAAIEDQIKQLLGEDNYSQYQAYGKTLSERMVVTQFSDQLADSPKAVRPEQEQQLFDAMVEERQKFAFTTDFSDPSKLKGDVASYYTEDNKQRYQQELEQLSQRYLGRAQSILSPEQLGAFQTSLASQQAMQAASVTVGAKLFPAKSAAN